MTDKILIRQLLVSAVIGIHDWEKQQTQPLLIDLDLSHDCHQAALSDDIKDALDYFEVCRQVTDFVGASRYELIETLAEEITELIFRQFNCEHIELTLFKPEAVENTQTVGVSISRTRPS